MDKKQKKTIWMLMLAVGIILFLVNWYTYNWKFIISEITVLGWIIYSIAVTMILTGGSNTLFSK